MKHVLIKENENTLEIGNNIPYDAINKKKLTIKWSMTIYPNDYGNISVNIVPFLLIMNDKETLFSFSYLYAYDITLDKGEELTSEYLFNILHNSLGKLYMKYLSNALIYDNIKRGYTIDMPTLEDLKDYIEGEILRFKSATTNP